MSPPPPPLSNLSMSKKPSQVRVKNFTLARKLTPYMICVQYLGSIMGTLGRYHEYHGCYDEYCGT